MVAHNGSTFDNYAVIINLPQWRNIVKLIKIEAGLVSLNISNGYVDENKKIAQYVHFRCGRVHIISSLTKIGISYKLKPSLLKQEMEHDEIYEDTWEARENEWLRYVKNDVV